MRLSLWSGDAAREKRGLSPIFMVEAGVTIALESIAEELDITMASCGRRNPADLDRSILQNRETRLLP
ncbi:MAG: hypothetical protein ACKVQT_32065 [Burkholderiales bacterium]